MVADVTAADREARLARAAMDARWALDSMADALGAAGKEIPAWLSAARAECLKTEEAANAAWGSMTEAEKVA